jgi:hypothetical protein
MLANRQIVESPHWAFSAQKRPISLCKSSDKPERPILLIGGVHGDEPEGVWLAEAALEWLKSDSVVELSQRKNLKVLPWIVITCLNPDGLQQATRVNGNGVDLNRNYPSRSWSPTFENERYNPGPSAGSEPEIQALVRLIADTRPRLIIHCHSWHPCIVCTGEPGLSAAKALSDSSGYELKNEIGYPTPGSLSQFGWHDQRIPIICIEEAEGTQKEKVWPHFASAFEKIFLKAPKPNPTGG